EDCCRYIAGLVWSYCEDYCRDLMQILPGDQQSAQIVEDDRPTDEISLPFIATIFLEEGDVLRFFYALGNHLELESVRQCNDGLRNNCVVLISIAIEDKRLIDLDAIDRKTLEIGKAGKSGAEIIQRYLDAHVVQAVHYAHDFLD